MNDDAEPVEESARRQVPIPDGVGAVERFVHRILIPLLTAASPILVALLGHNR